MKEGDRSKDDAATCSNDGVAPVSGISSEEGSGNEATGWQWEGLPPEIIEIIGSRLHEGRHLQCASLVSKSWRASIASGMTHMDIDMHPDPARWKQRLELLANIMRALSVATVFVHDTVPSHILCGNLELMGQLSSLQDLHLRLSDSAELSSAAARALGCLRNLRTLSLIGGNFAPGAAIQLLVGLAAGCCNRRGGSEGAERAPDIGDLNPAVSSPAQGSTLYQGTAGPPARAGGSLDGSTGAGSTGPMGGTRGLRHLTLLPQVQSGLGDEEMEVLAQIDSLEVLEFRASRLTSRGLARLADLPGITSLAICSLDSEYGYELSHLRRMAALQHLSLALEEGRGPLVQLSGSCAASLALQFRWTERAAGLLREALSQLSNLRTLDMGVCRVNNQAVFDAVAQLTNLQDLRMAVYSNSDTAITCDLDTFSQLAGMRNFTLAKRSAFYPQHRRFLESNITVPVTAPAMSALAARWPGLRELRLSLSHTDYTADGLLALTAFSGLEILALGVERYPALPGQGSSCYAMHAALDVMLLPPSLTSLELHHLHLQLPDISDTFLSSRALSRLKHLELDACVLRPSCLLAIGLKAQDTLSSLCLINAIGLDNTAVANLAGLTNLSSLVLHAPRNDGVTQDSLARLTSLVGLKYLSWNSDDMSARGPSLELLAAFPGLRSLSLSCTRRTLEHAIPGGLSALQELLPYAHINLLPSSVHEHEQQPAAA